eukprot:352561-Chlamydomonas_euryale.AAC.17
MRRRAVPMGHCMRADAAALSAHRHARAWATSTPCGLLSSIVSLLRENEREGEKWGGGRAYVCVPGHRDRESM